MSFIQAEAAHARLARERQEQDEREREARRKAGTMDALDRFHYACEWHPDATLDEIWRIVDNEDFWRKSLEEAEHGDWRKRREDVTVSILTW